MRTARTPSELRSAVREARAAGQTVALVPTMGALHDGHLSLVAQARTEADLVVVSLFVNPTQFNQAADLDAYPRDEATDAAMLEQAGADLLFAPAVATIYPAGFTTAVSVTGPLTETLEAAERGRAHFDGVATVVTKLLNLVGPDVAIFGRKDAQQALVIQRLVDDLALPVRISLATTVREPDGLAMSSRNGRLSAEERRQAVALSQALRAARAAHAQGERDAHALLQAGNDALAAHHVEPEYLALVDPTDLSPLLHVDGRPALLAVAATLGSTRLIDNTTLGVHDSLGD